MRIITRKISIVVRRILFVFRNFYYKNIFDVGRNTVFLGRVFYYHSQYIKIGKNCSINEGVFFNAGTNIIIHDNVAISAGVFLTSAGGYTKLQKNGVAKTYHDNKAVEIGKGSWIGANATILNGVKIGENCIVAAGSVVGSNVEDGTVVVGNPARVTSRVKADVTK